MSFTGYMLCRKVIILINLEYAVLHFECLFAFIFYDRDSRSYLPSLDMFRVKTVKQPRYFAIDSEEHIQALLWIYTKNCVFN